MWRNKNATEYNAKIRKKILCKDFCKKIKFGFGVLKVQMPSSPGT